MPTSVVMPQLGESVVEGVVVKWRVKEGDVVKADDPLAEVETDKATTEVPSPASGKVVRLLAREGETIGVGKPILEIEAGATASEAVAKSQATGAGGPETERKGAPAAGATGSERGLRDSSSEDPQTGSAPVQVPVSAPLVLRAPAGQPASKPADAGHSNGMNGDARISPVVRKMAAEFNLDLSRIQGTGDGGRITKKDVQGYLSQGGAKTPPAAAAGSVGGGATSHGPSAIAVPAALQPQATEGDQVIPFSRRRKIIAERMSLSRRVVPEVTTFAEVDMAKVAQIRARYKAQGAKAPGAPRLTYLPFVCAATVRALRELPGVNAQAQEDSYVLKKDINLGIAVESEEGLSVPVIKRADALSLIGLARASEELGERARTGKLTADDYAGGTFTVSNPGLKGNLFGTPIINMPQAGILRMGEVVKRAVVVEMDGADAIVIRPMMYLAFAYDHRIIDGVAGNAFLFRVRELLEAGDFPL